MGDAWERVARRELDESADETNVRVDGSRWWARGGGDARGWRVDDAASARRARRRDDGGKTRGVHRGGDGGGDAPGRRWGSSGATGGVVARWRVRVGVLDGGFGRNDAIDAKRFIHDGLEV